MTREKLKFEYYYKMNSCPAKTAEDKNCICWHLEGTGPMPDQKHSDDVPLVEWRIANAK